MVEALVYGFQQAGPTLARSPFTQYVIIAVEHIHGLTIDSFRYLRKLCSFFVLCKASYNDVALSYICREEVSRSTFVTWSAHWAIVRTTIAFIIIPVAELILTVSIVLGLHSSILFMLLVDLYLALRHLVLD